MSDSEHDWLRPEEETESETIIDARTAQNNPEVADVVAKIASLRQSIDNVDTAIVSLLAERFKYTSQVGVLKARAGFAPADYQREHAQIERLHRIADEAGLDPEIAEILDAELSRQQNGLEMIASENFVPRAVLQAQGSVLTNKYAEGYPGRFYHAEAYGVNPETFRIDPEIIRQRTFDGAKILAERLLADDVKANGIFVLTGGTDVHLVMVDLRNSEMDGQQGEDLLAACGITINRNTVPFDPRPASVASGLRIGTSALATRGFGPKEYEEVADIIGTALAAGPSADVTALKARVDKLAEDFPLYPDLDQIH